MRKEAENTSTIYDDVFRTIQERHPKLLIPLINEAFHTEYAEDESVTRLPEEYQKTVSKVIADGCSVIGNRIYHIECQSTADSGIMLRMVEYDFMLALSHAEKGKEGYQIQFPHSCIFYLRHTKNTPEKEEIKLLFPDGQTIQYRVPTIKAQNYTSREIFEKKLYICLPYYIMRYEKHFHEISRDPEKTERFMEEYDQIFSELWEETRQEETGMYQDLLRLIRKIADYQLRKDDDLKERMGAVMGGKVLELPSDKLREAKAEGRSEGLTQGITQGITQGENRVSRLIIELQRQNRMDEVVRAATDSEYRKKLFGEFGI